MPINEANSGDRGKLARMGRVGPLDSRPEARSRSSWSSLKAAALRPFYRVKGVKKEKNRRGVSPLRKLR